MFISQHFVNVILYSYAARDCPVVSDCLAPDTMLLQEGGVHNRFGQYGIADLYSNGTLLVGCINF